MHIYNPITVENDEAQRGIMVKFFGQNIRRIRLKKKWTQEQVAEMAGISSTFYGEVERGLKCASGAVIYRLATALSVPVCAIMSSKRCPCARNGMPAQLAELMKGRAEHDIRKAVKIIAVLFEEHGK